MKGPRTNLFIKIGLLILHLLREGITLVFCNIRSFRLMAVGKQLDSN